MSLFKNLFAGNGNSLKQCPRCLGKGNVDWDDIKRLNQELKWRPGQCAYCNGTGKVDKDIENTLPADTSYLVIDVPEEQRRRMINGHPDAIEYGKQIDEDLEYFIEQISYLHFEGGLDSSRIAKFFLLGEEATKSYSSEYKDLVEYIDRVIAKKRNKTSTDGKSHP